MNNKLYYKINLYYLSNINWTTLSAIKSIKLHKKALIQLLNNKKKNLVNICMYIIFSVQSKI